MGKLINAVLSKNLDKVVELLEGEYKYSPLVNEEKNKRGFSALFIASQQGSTPIVEALIEAGANVNQPLEKSKEVPLIAAASRGHTETVRTLIEARANLEMSRTHNTTALFHAVIGGHLHTVQLLINAGADPTAKTTLGNTVLEKARQARHKAEKDSENYNKYQQIIKTLKASPKNHVSQVLSVSKLNFKPNIVKPEQLKIDKKLGSGGFGIVYKGKWLAGGAKDAAIKQLKVKDFSKEDIENFKREAGVMASLRHPNIVEFWGITVTQPYSIVMEFMPNGSLYDVLKSKQALTKLIKFKIALDIASGLAFLHSKDIVHQDLKSLNVLMTEGLRAKLADFGLAVVFNKQEQYAGGTRGWAAPELYSVSDAKEPLEPGEDSVQFKIDAKSTKESDMYSYGVTAWELMSRKLPKNSKKDIDKMVKGYREKIPEDTHEEFSKIITFAWQANPANRLTADQAVHRLSKAIDEFEKPKKPKKPEKAEVASASRYVENEIPKVRKRQR